jgi:hypothetical protein
MADQGRMTRGAVVRLAGRPIHSGDEFAHRRAKADTLIVGQAHGAVLAPAGPGGVGEVEHRGERGDRPVDIPGKARSGAVQILAQIMMALEDLPRFAAGAEEIKPNVPVAMSSTQSGDSQGTIS